MVYAIFLIKYICMVSNNTISVSRSFVQPFVNDFCSIIEFTSVSPIMYIILTLAFDLTRSTLLLIAFTLACFPSGAKFIPNVILLN